MFLGSLQELLFGQKVDKNRKNIIKHNPQVTRKRRERLNKHKSFVLWLTGLSGAGKSTLAHAVEEELHNKGFRTYVLDGDNIRQGLSSNLTFSDDDRKENIRRIAEVSKLMIEAGMITISAFISPFSKDRNLARQLFNYGDFFEVFCNASLDVCMKRDVKGLYRRVSDGEIKNFTGIGSPYEIPENPDLVINTDSESIEESVARIMNFLKLNKNI